MKEIGRGVPPWHPLGSANANFVFSIKNVGVGMGGQHCSPCKIGEFHRLKLKLMQ